MKGILRILPFIVLSLIVGALVIESCDRFCYRKGINRVSGLDTKACLEDSLEITDTLKANVLIEGYSTNDLLRAYETSSGLLSANGLTYIVTLIVALLATLLLYRIEEVEHLSRKNEKLEEEAKSYYVHASAYNELLTRFESIYDLTMIISSLVLVKDTIDKNTKDEQRVLEKIGSICSRVSILLEKVELVHYGVFARIAALEKAEKEIIETYLKDTQDELNRISSLLKKGKAPIFENVEALSNRLSAIEIVLDRIPIRN